MIWTKPRFIGLMEVEKSPHTYSLQVIYRLRSMVFPFFNDRPHMKLVDLLAAETQKREGILNDCFDMSPCLGTPFRGYQRESFFC